MNLKKMIRSLLTSSLVVVASLISPPTATGADPLPSWTDGSAKTAIIEFVETVTQEGGKGYLCRAFGTHRHMPYLANAIIKKEAGEADLKKFRESVKINK